ncbi:ketoacyl-synt-domain-containing protein [Aspergillus aurantiobrunneus]
MISSADDYMLLFGDQTTAFEPVLHTLVHVKSHGTLTDFFDRVCFYLRRYVGSLPSHQQDWFPYFTTMIDLFAQHESMYGAPALKFTLLCVTELAQFIHYFGQGSRSYPPPDTTYLVGACTGSLAAAAISTSRSLAELLPAAVETVIVAFRVGLRCLTLRHDLGSPVSGEPKAWSAVVGAQHPDAAQLVARFNTDRALHAASVLYISSVSLSSVTISGPPRHLADFLSSNALKHSVLPIELPFHAPHLFLECELDELIQQFHDARLNDYGQQVKVVSAVSGELVSSLDFRTLVKRAVQEALRDSLRWDLLSQGLAEILTQSEFSRCEIYQVSSTSGPFLSSSLSRESGIEVKVANIIDEASATEPVPTPDGKFANSDIAIIGYSGRFPESASNEEFWDLLMAGRDVHRTIPEDRFDWEAHYDPTGRTKNTSRVKYGCFIKEPGLFDARFFNMSPREAENCDPAQRLAITTAYEAMEMAGLVPNSSPSTRQDRIGVFYGVTSDDWREVNSGQEIDTYFIPGGNRAFIPGRISYFFRFCGPSLSIDTACSSSFAAIQTACVYLWRGECDTCVAGGANILTNPDNFAGLDRGHFLTTTGNCNAFDDGASGYCRSDAVGSVILKRLDDAVADNDPIFGVIKGAFTNHCGRTDSITRPFEGDQAAVFNRIMRYTGLNPLDVGYVEMHGTGTQAGDATEMKSVMSVFAPDPERQYPLYLGTAKANIGHAESASGVSSLIKVLMMMKNNAIPPHCGIKTKINRNYPTDLKERNIHIPFKPIPWYSQDMAKGKRTVFLNNFSAAGGNTAMLMEDAPTKAERLERDPRPRYVVTASAKSARSLQGNVEALIRHLEEQPELTLSSLSYTTTARRIHQNYRVMVSGSDITAIHDQLQQRLQNIMEIKPVPTGVKTPKVVFVFTGQGALYHGIGQQLYETVTAYRSALLRFNRIVEQQGFPAFLPLINGSLDPHGEISPIVSHLALACVQMALCTLWKGIGILPSATIGHSLGEYPALYAAGVLTAGDVIYLVGSRAKLLTENASPRTHGMLAVRTTQTVIAAELAGTPCEVACLNQPASNVVSGPMKELETFRERLSVKGIECVPLDVPYAFHSAQVDSVVEAFSSITSRVAYRRPSVPYISPLLGKVIPAGDTSTLDARYLTHACRRPVNFQAAVEAYNQETPSPETLWLEIGAHPMCSGMIKGTLGSSKVTIPSLRKNADPWAVLTAALETLYSHGVDIAWTEYHRGFEKHQEVLSLPRYSWDLKNYWIQYRANFCLTKGDGSAERPVQAPPEIAPYLSPSAQRVLQHEIGSENSKLLAESDIHDPRLLPIFEGHVVNGAQLCSSSVYADVGLTIAKYMVESANMEGKDSFGYDIAEMRIQNAFVSRPDREPQLFHAAASANWKENTISFQIYSVRNEGKKLADHASFVVHITPQQRWMQEWKRSAYLIRSRIRALHASVEEGSSHKIKRSLAYHLFGVIVDYGDRYQGMQEVVLDAEQHEATSRVRFQTGSDGFVFNPCWVDSLGHIAGFIMNASDFNPSRNQVFINHGWDRMRWAAAFEEGKQYQVYNRMQLESGTTYIGDTYIFDGEDLVGVFEGVCFQGVPRRVLDRLRPPTAPANRPVEPTRPAPVSARQQQPKPLKSQQRESPKSPVPNRASQIMAIIAQEAGVSLPDLIAADDFASHGIDSLLSLTICGKIQEELGTDVPSSLFVEYPSPRELMAFFGDGDATPASSTSISEIDSDTKSQSDTGDTDGTSDLELEPEALDIIRQTILEETGISVDEFTSTTSFSSVGVDSLLALTIVSKLGEALDMDLQPTVLMEHDSLEEVAKALGLCDNPDVRPLPALSRFDPTAGPAATSILLWGNPAKAKKVLFLFPDGSGSATSYASLPKLKADTAAYGLNCPWMKSPWELKCTLEELTSKYVIEIRRRQPKGPYYLGGWSAGGICAYEAAQQLARSGEKTERLILIDSPNPIGLENPPQRMYDFFESLGIFGTEGKPPPAWLRPHFDAFIRLLDEYKIQPYAAGDQVKSFMVYARDGICNSPDVPRPELRPDDPREMIWLINNRTDFSGEGWASLVGKNNLDVTVLSNVNHFTMMDPGSHMEDMGEFLKKALL